jgi:hypothetical protein
MDKDKLAKILGEQPVSMSSVGGGCIADSQVISTRSGKKYFLKQGFSNGMFKKEAHGLQELAHPAVIKIPKVISGRHKQTGMPIRSYPLFFLNWKMIWKKFWTEVKSRLPFCTEICGEEITWLIVQEIRY